MTSKGRGNDKAPKSFVYDRTEKFEQEEYTNPGTKKFGFRNDIRQNEEQSGFLHFKEHTKDNTLGHPESSIAHNDPSKLSEIMRPHPNRNPQFETYFGPFGNTVVKSALRKRNPNDPRYTGNDINSMFSRPEGQNRRLRTLHEDPENRSHSWYTNRMEYHIPRGETHVPRCRGISCSTSTSRNTQESVNNKQTWGITENYNKRYATSDTSAFAELDSKSNIAPSEQEELEKSKSDDATASYYAERDPDFFPYQAYNPTKAVRETDAADKPLLETQEPERTARNNKKSLVVMSPPPKDEPVPQSVMSFSPAELIKSQPHTHTIHSTEYRPTTHVFPFKETLSGHLLIEPSLVAFENKRISVLVSNPKKTHININIAKDPVEASLVSVPEVVENIEYRNQPVKQKQPISQEKSVVRTHTSKQQIDLLNEDLNTPVLAKDPEEIRRFLLQLKEGDEELVVEDMSSNERAVTRKRQDSDNIVLSYNYSETSQGSAGYMENIHTRIRKAIHPDLYILIGSNKFPCHSIALQACSKYFDNLKRPKESIHRVELPEFSVPADLFPVIMDWTVQTKEGKKAIVTKENAIGLYCAANYLDISDLRDQCLKFVRKNVSTRDPMLIPMWEAVRKRLKCQEMITVLASKAAALFPSLYHSRKFLKLDVDEITMILDSDEVIIDSELDIFDAAVRWILYDWNVRKKYIIMVMKTVRYGLMSPLNLAQVNHCPDTVDPSTFKEYNEILNQTEVKKMYDSGLAYSILKESYLSRPEELNKWVDTSNIVIPRQRLHLVEDNFQETSQRKNSTSNKVMDSPVGVSKDIKPESHTLQVENERNENIKNSSNKSADKNVSYTVLNQQPQGVAIESYETKLPRDKSEKRSHPVVGPDTSSPINLSPEDRSFHTKLSQNSTPEYPKLEELRSSLQYYNSIDAGALSPATPISSIMPSPSRKPETLMRPKQISYSKPLTPNSPDIVLHTESSQHPLSSKMFDKRYNDSSRSEYNEPSPKNPSPSSKSNAVVQPHYSQDVHTPTSHTSTSTAKPKRSAKSFIPVPNLDAKSHYTQSVERRPRLPNSQRSQSAPPRRVAPKTHPPS